MLLRLWVRLLLVIVSIGDFMTTQYANASYQEIIDLHTESDRVSVVGIHTPCSDTPYHMLKGFWDQFRKFRYNGCSISLVPAAMLPADPLQVSYDAGEPTIDPRDMLNPIMFHGCHGNDMGEILNSLYSDPVSGVGQMIECEQTDSVDHNKAITSSGGLDFEKAFEVLYYRALTDKTWLKAHPQRGFRKSGLHPMIYSVASTMQIGNSNSGDTLLPKGFVHDPLTGEESGVNTGQFGSQSSGAGVYSSSGFGRPTMQIDQPNWIYTENSARVQSFLTPRLQRLGWMDTRSVIGVKASGSASGSVNPSTGGKFPEGIADMYLNAYKTHNPVLTPKIFMAMLLLPPAYKTEQHFRLILNHSYSFAKFRGASMQYEDRGSLLSPYAYFDFSGQEDSKHIDPEPEPEPKEDEKNDS